jgi:hypothetical protein
MAVGSGVEDTLGTELEFIESLAPIISEYIPE